MKKFYLLMFALLLASISVFNSCKPKDPDDEQKPEFSMSDDINIYSEDIIQYVSDDSVFDSLLFFEAGLPNELLPKKNEYIYIPETEKTPYGVLA